MADLTAVTDKYFTVASETFEDNLSATIGALAATVPVNNASEYDDGDNVVLTVEPGTANEATFVGTKSGNEFINCEWTEGNLGVGHALGATIVDYDSATHHNLQTKGISQFANSDGTLKPTALQAALGLGSEDLNGWNVLGYTPASVTNNGQRSYTCVFNGVDLRTTLSPGMRLRTTRTVAGPTQVADLESSSSQYASKTTPTGITFTDDFTCEAWVKLESYTSANILTRYNGTNGWRVAINNAGNVAALGYNGSGANYKATQSIQSLPIGRWVHVSVHLDMNATGNNQITFDGVIVQGQTLAGGTSPSSLIQAGNLQLGAHNGAGDPIDGKLSDVRLWTGKRSEAQVRENMSQQLTGSESDLIGYWKLNGNFNDSTTNANHLTSSGGALATNADAPFSVNANGTVTTYDYGIVQSVAYGGANTTVVVQAAESCAIPTSGGVSSVVYSNVKVPYLFPAEPQRWAVEMVKLGGESFSIPATGSWYATQTRLAIPAGKWIREAKIQHLQNSSVGGIRRYYIGYSDSITGATGPNTDKFYFESSGSTSAFYNETYISNQYSCDTLTTNYILVNLNTATGVEVLQICNAQYGWLRATNAYL